MNTESVHDNKICRRLRLKLTCILVCAMMLSIVILTGCEEKRPSDTEAVASHTLRIGVSVYDDYDTLMSEVETRINAWARDKERVSGNKIILDIVSANGSQLTQNDQVAKFVDKGYDVICVNLVDRTDATVIIDKARNADVPVIFFNREPVKEDLERWERLYYVGANAEQAGALQAELVTNVLSNPKRFAEVDRNNDRIIQYVILEGETGHQDSLMRTQISIEQIQESGFVIEKIGDEIANWNRTQATSKMYNLLEKTPAKIEMVIANDDDMALGALDAIISRGAPLPLIVGVNGTKDALEMVKTQKMAGTVYNDIPGQVKQMMELAYSLGLNSEPPEGFRFTQGNSLYMDYRLIDYDNVQEFIRMRE